MVKKYRKKPIEIEAIEITGPEVFPEIEKWMESVLPEHSCEKIKIAEHSKDEYNCYLNVNSNPVFQHTFGIGDFVVKGVDGSIYPVSKESFWKVYDETNSKEVTW